MSLTILLEACLAIYMVAIFAELIIRRKLKHFLIEIVVIIGIVLLALLLTNAVNGRVSFGEGTSPMKTVGVMFVATMLGIAARYVFYLQKGHFSWLDIVKPLTITPIVLLPLIGSLQGMGDVKDMQVVSFGFLSFQNGFFWQAVLEGAKPATQTTATVAPISASAAPLSGKGPT